MDLSGGEAVFYLAAILTVELFPGRLFSGRRLLEWNLTGLN
jgi:hypothetical protein